MHRPLQAQKGNPAFILEEAEWPQSQSGGFGGKEEQIYL
jgi:hypothetical protein